MSQIPTEADVLKMLDSLSNWNRWGADDLSCLSIYDGLMCVRLNPLGAWCLGIAWLGATTYAFSYDGANNVVSVQDERHTTPNTTYIALPVVMMDNALPGHPLTARINYVSAAIDPATRRLLVRATIDNKDGRLKPEMFANVTIYSASDHPAIGVPKQALIYEGDQVRVWVAHEDKTIELRQIKPGLTNGDLVEVEGNLKPGEQIVTKGSLFIDRAASGS